MKNSEYSLSIEEEGGENNAVLDRNRNDQWCIKNINEIMEEKRQ